MKKPSPVQIEIDYTRGLETRALYKRHLPQDIRQCLERQHEAQGMPPLEALAQLFAGLDACKPPPGLSKDASALRALTQAFKEQDQRRDAWLEGRRAPQLPELRSRLSPAQLEAAAFLAFRGRAILADPRALEPEAAAVGACLILLAQGAIHRAIIVCAESRQSHWQELLERLTDARGELVAGPREERLPRYAAANGFIVITADEFTQDRTALQPLEPLAVILDEAGRHWGDESRVPRVTARLDPIYLFALTHQDPTRVPAGLFNLLSVMYPALAGPQAAWLKLYVGFRKYGGLPQHLTELANRVRPVIMRRELEALSASGLPAVQEIRRIPLTVVQRSTYDRTRAALKELLEQPVLSPHDQRRIESLLSTLRECTDSMTLFQRRYQGASKLDELLELVRQQVSVGGRKVLIFSRWEEMNREISAHLRQGGLSLDRHYRRLPLARKEEICHRFSSDPDALILVSTDSLQITEPLKADVLVHFDIPWHPAVLTWRRAMVQSGPVEEFFLVAAQTLEEELVALPRPFSVPPDLVPAEEQAGHPFLLLFGPEGDATLRRLYAMLEVAVPRLLRTQPPPSGPPARSTPLVPKETEGGAPGIAPTSVPLPPGSPLPEVVDHLSQAAGESLRRAGEQLVTRAEAVLQHGAAQSQRLANVLASGTIEQAADRASAAVGALGERAAAVADDLADATDRLLEKAADRAEDLLDSVSTDAAPLDGLVQTMAGLSASVSDRAQALKHEAEASLERLTADASELATHARSALESGLHQAEVTMEQAIDRLEDAIDTVAGDDHATAPEVPADSSPGLHSAEVSGQSPPSASAPEGEGYWQSYQHAESAAPSDEEPAVVEQIEAPLKAVNRILAGVPVVGESLSQLNSRLWDSFTGRFRNKS